MGTLMRIPDFLRVVVPAFAVGALLAPQPCRSQTNQATAATQPATASPMPMLLETRAKLGTTLLYAHKYDQAIAEFDKVLKSDPNHYDARLGMARAYYWTKRPREAAETLRPLITRKPTPEVTALWNELAAASGDTVSALKAMDSALKERAGDLKLWEAKAGLLTASGSYAPAIKQLQELLKQNGDSANIKLQLAHAYFTADRYPEAIEIYRNLMDDGPPVGREARTAMARIQLKACYLAEAKETLEKLMNAEPNDPRPYLGFVTLWILDRNLYTLDADHLVKKLGECDLPDKMSAIDSVREWMFTMLGKLISLPADDASLKLARGIAGLLGENPETPTLRVCRQVLDQYAEDGPKGVKPDPEPFLASVRDGSLPRAEVYNLCHLLLALYAGEALVKVCDAYLELEPQDISVMLFRAEGLATTAQYADADEAYLAILDKMPENSKARRGLARNYSWYRAFDKCYDYYKELIEQDPTDMVVRREYARALGWDKRLLKSLDTYDEAIDACGDDSAGQVWKKMLTTERKAKHDYWWGYDKKAAERYQEAISYEPGNMEARFDLGQVYANNRHWEESADQYHQILNTIDARHRRASDALYKNSIYHEPELTVAFDWGKRGGFGDQVDIETTRLKETLKQEIAKRTDLSVIETQMWHRFPVRKQGAFDEFRHEARLDHRFNLQTYGHITAGATRIGGSDEEWRFVGDFELTYKALDQIGVSFGGFHRPFEENWATIKEAIDESRLYVRLFGNIDPWLDWYVQYGHSWLDKGERWRTHESFVINHRNAYRELLWGANYRFSLFPKILQFEYHGIAWWFDHDVPEYFAPSVYNVHIFRLGWRHYLNTDQYFEQRQFYYEGGISMSVDSDGASGTGYDLGLGWDLCHHFGFEVKWSQSHSSVYEQQAFWIQGVMRF